MPGRRALRRGHSPARRKDDLPEPDAPRMTSMRLTPARTIPRSLMSPSTICRSSEEDGGVLLLEIRKARIGPAIRLEGEVYRVKAGVFQPLFETHPSLRVAGEIDELRIGQIERHLALVDPGERNDDLFAHQHGGVDL